MPGTDVGDVKNGFHEILGLNSLSDILLSAIADPDDHNDKDVVMSKPVAMSIIIDRIDQELSDGACAQRKRP